MTFEEALTAATEKVHVRNSVPGRLSGKIAVVTGGAQGFGYGIAEEMYKEGADIVIADVNEATGREAAALNRLRERDLQDGKKPVTDTELDEKMGHTLPEIIAGCIVGILCAAVVYRITGGRPGT